MPKNEQELALVAELDNLEKSLLQKGGDALQNAPHDGGFATQGTNIQTAAKAKKKILKGLLKGGMSKKAAEKLMKGMDESSSSSDDSSSDEVEKGLPSDDDSSGDDESSDDESVDESDDESVDVPPMKKSTGAAQLANVTSTREKKRGGEIRKAFGEEEERNIDAVPILDKLIRTLDTNGTLQKSELVTLRKSLEKSAASQATFNTKAVQAFIVLGQKVNELMTLTKSIADQPIQPRQPQLRKGDVRQPEFHGNNGSDWTQPEESPLEDLAKSISGMFKIQEVLVDMVMKGDVPGLTAMDVTKFENAKGDFSILPKEVVKRLNNRLFPASA